MCLYVENASLFLNRNAITDTESTYTYHALIEGANKISTYLLMQNGQNDLAEERIAFMAVQNAQYTQMQWGIWQAGGVAVPLSLSYPLPELEYVLTDTNAKAILCPKFWASKIAPLATKLRVQLIITEEILATQIKPEPHAVLPSIAPERRALIIYTSGTTSRPKGVVSTHANLEAQITVLTSAWEWQADDVILHVLPLHHVHGVINALACPLWCGAEVVMLPKFDAALVWQMWQERAYSVFMAVPTVYHKLIEHWEQTSPTAQASMRQSLKNLRLMVSGSAALPISVLEKWQEISGYTLLERYGMTEIGMALSNPLQGIRKAGHVGLPLKGVELKLSNEEGQTIEETDTAGEIVVRGRAVFKEYRQKPEATEAVLRQGWFYTGDIAQRDAQGYYRILGRSSQDIIKTGGYKVSALEIEEVLRTNTAIAECAVVGIADEAWGELVAVAVVLKPTHQLTLATLRDWAKQFLAHYKVPSKLLILEDLPRNSMGKVLKNQLKDLF